MSVKCVIAGLGAALFVTTATQAAFVPQFQSAVYTVATDRTVVTYNLNFTPGTGETVQTNDYVTIYDIGQIVGAGGLTASSQIFGTTPAGVSLTDTAAANITYIYSGPVLTSTTNFIVTYTQAGNFTQGTRVGTYASVDGFATGGRNAQTGTVVIPVPEPAGVALAAVGAVGLLRRRRA